MASMFEIKDVPEMGKGMVPTVDLRRGQLIAQETPIMTSPPADDVRGDEFVKDIEQQLTA